MDPIYLDHAATTPLRDEVREAMAPFQGSVFGNASSLHRWGRAAEAALERAREEVAGALGARPPEIYFVRGGTESDNLAVIGSIRARATLGRPTLAVSVLEHSAVLDAAAHVREGDEADVRIVGVSPDGTLDMDALTGALSQGNATVSVMWVNNETGLILPVPEVVERAASAGAVVHSDAAQAVGKVPVDLREVRVDLLTATGHKINGPKGTGILFVREGTTLHPLLHGGGQERRLRPGTEDVAGAVGFATALRLAVEEQAERARRLEALRLRLEDGVRSALPELRVNGGDGPRAPHVSSLGLPMEDGAAFIMALDLEGIAVSGGSACHSAAPGASHVIAALYGDEDRRATVRFSFGLGTTPEEVDRAVEATVRVAGRMVNA